MERHQNAKILKTYTLTLPWRSRYWLPTQSTTKSELAVNLITLTCHKPSRTSKWCQNCAMISTLIKLLSQSIKDAMISRQPSNMSNANYLRQTIAKMVAQRFWCWRTTQGMAQLIKPRVSCLMRNVPSKDILDLKEHFLIIPSIKILTFFQFSIAAGKSSMKKTNKSNLIKWRRLNKHNAVQMQKKVTQGSQISSVFLDVHLSKVLLSSQLWQNLSVSTWWPNWTKAMVSLDFQRVWLVSKHLIKMRKLITGTMQPRICGWMSNQKLMSQLHKPQLKILWARRRNINSVASYSDHES